MKYRFVIVAFVVGMIPLDAAAGQCRAADDATDRMRSYLIELVSAPASDVEATTVRTSYQLPAVASSKVVVVTNRRKCGRLLETFNAARPDGDPPATEAYVIAVGKKHYVVWVPTPDRHWTTHMVVDSKYAVLAKFAG